MNDTTDTTATPESKKLGRIGLVGIVVGAMVGGGIFNLPQNMAAEAAVGAVMIAWVITGFGMFFLANTFRVLSDERPDLKSGIYTYAREGFGRFLGFEMAWGYWLSAAFGNVAFAVLVMQTLAYFFPVFGNGNNWQSILGGSLLIWALHFIVLLGVSRAAALNTVATIVKFIPLILIAAMLFVAFHWSEFTFDLWGKEEKLGSVLDQVKSTMLVTLWAFIGIEGAVVLSARAKKPESVGSATLIGLAACITIYIALSVLPFGVLHQTKLAALKDPSSAYLLGDIVGSWGTIFVNIGVLVAILGCWLSWTLLVAEVPYEAAKDGVFPRGIAKQNRHHSPARALWMSTILMQLTILVVLFANDAWLFLLKLTGVMVLPPYLASAGYLWKVSSSKEAQSWRRRGFAIGSGVVATLYTTWLLYAAGPKFLLLSTMMYALGIPMFWYAHRDREPGQRLFTVPEWIVVGALVSLAIAAVVLLSTGTITLA